MTGSKRLLLATEQSTLQAGAALAGRLEPGMVVFLRGPLGGGKTTLVRGVAQGLGHVGVVRSPSYTLVETYPLKGLTLCHMDLYRLHAPEELAGLGLRDYLDGRSALFVEWPEQGAGGLPEPDVELALDFHGEGRRLDMHIYNERGGRLMADLEEAVPA